MEVKTSGEDIIINQSIDQMLENLPIGSIERSIGNNLYGLNFRQTGNVVPRAKDSYGFTFFTRPQLNLSQLNITNHRSFYNLMTTNEKSYQRYVRLMLDPRLGKIGGLKSPFVDNLNAFIPILTNNTLSLSGWPDITVPNYTTPSGLYGQEHSFVDGVTNHYESFDIDVTFKNIKGSPLIYLFFIWLKYESLVFEGILNPYTDMITENEIDYNTRIYRVLLDEQKRYVTHIAATGASFPINNPTGNIFDFSVEKPLNVIKDINIRFRSLGFIAFEDIVKLEFNKSIAIFNSDIKKILKHDLDDSTPDSNKLRDDGTKVYKIPGTSYVKIPYHLAVTSDSSIFNNSFYNLNYKAYPYINLTTNEFEWWIDETRMKINN